MYNANPFNGGGADHVSIYQHTPTRGRSIAAREIALMLGCVTPASMHETMTRLLTGRACG